MITDRDYEIVRHLEQYKYATLSQIEKIFLRQQQYSYNIARKRLIEIRKSNYIKKPYKDPSTNKNIYIYNDDKINPPTQHRILILDVYAEMKYMGFEVEHFEVEKHWIDENSNKKFYSDGLAIFTTDNRRYHYFIEVQTSNNLHNLEKYDALYDTGMVQKFYGKDFFPKRILLISDRQYTKPIELKHCQVIQLDCKLSNFFKILM